MKDYIKNTYMKLVAFVVTVSVGAPAGYFLGFTTHIRDTNTTTITKYIWVWEQALGFWLLFLFLGFIAFLLACIYHNQKRKEK